MASEKQVAASRRNGRRGTGPRSAAGKRRTRRNALRHGLAATLADDPARSAEAERLASALAGTDDPLMRGYAVQAAEAELTLLRVRHMRIAVMQKIAASNEHEHYSPEWFEAWQRTSDQVTLSWPGVGKLRNSLVPLFRTTQRMLDPSRIETREPLVSCTPDLDRQAWAFMTALPELVRLERYERRAYARRRRALRLLAAAMRLPPKKETINGSTPSTRST